MQQRVVSPLLGAAVLLAAIGVVAGVGKYDPCATPGLATIVSWTRTMRHQFLRA